MKHILNRGTLRPKASQALTVRKFNRAELAAMDVTGYAAGTRFDITCGSVLGDGGERSYWYDPTSTIPAIPGLVIIPASGPGRLLQHYGLEIDPARHMGADPKGVSDSASIIQAALDFASTPTYGWATVSGQTNQTTLTVTLSGAFKLLSPLNMRPCVLKGKPGSYWGDYGAHAVLHVTHGGHGIIIDQPSDSPKFRNSAIENLFLQGYSELYQQNLKPIQAVVSRFVFDVLDADAPPILDDNTIWASHNTCFFYDPDTSYLGSARIESVAASPTSGMTRVTLANDGTDVFSSINNDPGDALSTACKVVWPVRITDEGQSAFGISDFNDPAAAGSCAIFIKSTTAVYGSIVGNPRISNIMADRFHCGLRIGPKVVSHDPYYNIITTRNRFAGISFPRPINTTDAFFTGEQWYSSEYRPDYGVTRTQGALVTFTAGTPGTVHLTAHNFRIGSAIQFTSVSTTLMGGLVMKKTFFISANGYTTNSFRLTSTFQGADVDLSGTNSDPVYIYGSVVDTPGLRNGPYAMHGISCISRWPSILAEFASYAGIYLYRQISANMDHVYLDSCMRGIVFGCGYNTYSSPSTSTYNGWLSIDRLEVKAPLGGTVFDTMHTNRAAIEFEDKGAGARFNGISIGQLCVIGDPVGPDFDYVFNLRSTSHNNRAIVGSLVDINGAATLHAPGTKSAEFSSHIGITSASDIQRGWYDNGTKRAFSLSGSDVFALDSTGALFGNSSFAGSPVTSLSNSGTAITLKRVGGSPQVFSLRIAQNSFRLRDDDLALDALSIFANTTINQLWIGSYFGNSSGVARSSNLYAESRSGGVDLEPLDLNIVGPGGTGAAATNGSIKFWTANPTTSGSGAQSVSLRMQIKRTGQLNLSDVPNPANLAEGDFWFNTTKGFRQYFGAAERPVGFKSCGTATLVAGTVTVSVGAVLTSTSEVLITSQVDGGTPGWLRVSSKITNVSFTVTSSSATDTSTFFWAIVHR